MSSLSFLVPSGAHRLRVIRRLKPSGSGEDTSKVFTLLLPPHAYVGKIGKIREKGDRRYCLILFLSSIFPNISFTNFSYPWDRLIFGFINVQSR